MPADVDHAFLCGPLDMIAAAAEGSLVDGRLASDRIHREIFTTKQLGTVTSAPQQITETSVAVAHGRALLHGTGVRRSSSTRATACSMPCNACVRTPRSRAAAACARHVRRWFARAR